MKEKEFKITKHIKIPNAPEYIDEITSIIINRNPSIRSTVNNSNEIFDADLSEENQERLIESYNKLITSIRAFEEAILYIK